MRNGLTMNHMSQRVASKPALKAYVWPSAASGYLTASIISSLPTSINRLLTRTYKTPRRSENPCISMIIGPKSMLLARSGIYADILTLLQIQRPDTVFMLHLNNRISTSFDGHPGWFVVRPFEVHRNTAAG